MPSTTRFSFEIANFYGGANELITWPTGFLAVISGGSDNVTIVDETSCLVQGGTEGEIQNWGVSSHGTVGNPPGGYTSVLDEPTGSCAGAFGFGDGGGYIAHMPLEWGWNCCSVAFPTNFDICECGEPVAVESTNWGAVKSLYR